MYTYIDMFINYIYMYKNTKFEKTECAIRARAAVVVSPSFPKNLFRRNRFFFELLIDGVCFLKNC